MNVKTDTKEKFVVVTPEVDTISANMTAELEILVATAAQSAPNLIVNMQQVEMIASEAAGKLAALQQSAYERNQSFVLCCLREAVIKSLKEEGLTEILNITPTESEAWDMVQMEEIERELLRDFDE